MNTPTLRFKEFSGAWEVKSFKDLTEILRCGIASTPIYVEKGVPFLSAQNVNSEGKIVLEKYNFISEEYYKELSKNHELLKGDLLYSRVGAAFGNAAVFELDGNYGVYVSLTHIRPNKKLNNYFLKFFLNCDVGQKQAKFAVVKGGGVPNLNVKAVEKFKITFPTLPEQNKIANFLTAIDEKIAQLSQTAQLLTDYKKGVMQQIFSQQLRFKDDDGREFAEWEEKSLGEVGNFIGGGTPSTQNFDWWNGNVPWISSSDLTEQSIHKINVTRFISETAISQSATKLVPKNSVLIVSRVGVGKVAVNDVDICTSQDFTSLVPYSDNSIFLAYLLKLKTKNLLEFNQGTSIKGFVKSDLEELKISLPCEKEQTKIANFLTAIDDKINNNQTQWDSMKQYKSGLLQQMFV